MTRFRAAVVLALTTGSVAAAADPPRVVRADPLPAWDAKFRRADGWVGGDGAYSVVVADDRALWLFSDTWVGSVRGGRRSGVVLVNNTVGVQTGTGDRAEVTFAVGRGKDGKPAALLTPLDGRGWFWLQAGAYRDGKLCLFLAQVEKTTDPGAFGFRHVGQWLGVVTNPDADPTAWKWTATRVPGVEYGPAHTRSFGSAVLSAGDFVYVYGYDERPGKPFPRRQMLVARAPAVQLAEFAAWRFWSGREWKADVGAAAPVADGLATEYSVSYLPGLKQYAAVYTADGLSDRVVGRFAAAPEGPWSDPVLLYRCPEMKRNKGVFSYAAKAHPHLAGENELIVSYVVNSFDLAGVIADAGLYWPRFVRVGLAPR